jgi:hypothetical protein
MAGSGSEGRLECAGRAGSEGEPIVLQAIAQQKARSFLLAGGIKPRREDIMTSGVFGCLNYLREEDASVPLSWMLPRWAPAASFENVEFWPKRSWAGCEPDAIIRWRRHDGTPMAFIVEAKYGRNRLGPTQLARQAKEFDGVLRAEGREISHLLVVQHKGAVDLAIAEDKLSQLITWRQIRDNLYPRTVGGSPLARWAADVVQVIEQGGDRPFQGFSPAPAVESLAVPVFHRRGGGPTEGREG